MTATNQAKRLRVRVEQAIARGESNTQIMADLSLSYEQLRRMVDEFNADVFGWGTDAVRSELDAWYGGPAVLERERRIVAFNRLVSSPHVCCDCESAAARTLAEAS